jgi:cell division septum initiation protein DivIVA
MTRSLAAAQEVAAELIDQAHNDVMLIRLNADQLASEVVRAAKAEASRIVRGTMAQAQAHLEAAKAQGNEILREAHGQRSRIGAELDERSARMQAEMQRLHEYRQRLEQAYDQVARTLAEGRAALQGAAGPPPPVRATAEPRPPSRAQVAAQEPRAISREEPERAERAERVGVRPRPDRRRAPVFDRSGAPARVAASDPPPVTKGVTRSVRFASVDAVAG